MQSYNITLKPKADLSRAENIIEECVKKAGLNLKSMGTLSTYPESVHWHLKQGNLPGTLELTLYKKEHRVWFSVQSRRRATWIENAMTQLRKLIEENLNEC